MRGVGHKTRREIGELVKRLQERFPQAPVVPRPAVPDTGEAVASAPAAHSLDLIVPHLVPRRAGAKGAEERVLRLLLGLERPHAPHETDPETGLRLGDYFTNFVDAEGRALAGRR